MVTKVYNRIGAHISLILDHSYLPLLLLYSVYQLIRGR